MANYFSGAGDGHVQNDVSDTYANAHSATAGTAVSATAASARCGIRHDDAADTSWNIYRLFLPFDTSAIGSSGTVTAASLYVYGLGSENTDNDGDDWITVVQTNQADTSTLTTSDFDQCGSVSNPTEGVDAGGRIDISSFNTSGYNQFVLNATGRGWIDKVGTTKLGLREGHDAQNIQLAGNTRNTIDIYMSEQTGTSNDPYLEVTVSYPEVGEKTYFFFM